MEKRKVLGRGISSLIPAAKPQSPAPAPSAEEESSEKTNSSMVDIQMIRVNPRQPRKVFTEQALKELTASVKEKGVLQPLLVSRRGAHYELIAGERRYRAAKAAGLKHVPVRVLESDDQEQLEIALIENIIREDLNPIEEARGYEKLQREFSLTHEEISKKVSKNRATVTNALRLLKLPLTVQQEVSRGNLSMGHARALLSIEDEKLQLQVAQAVFQKNLSVRQTEALVAQVTRPKTTPAKTKKENPNLVHVKEEMQRKLGTKVEIKEKAKGGEIRIQYFSPEDFHRLSQLLRR